MTLWSDFLSNQGRTIHKWKHYFPVYEAHFARFVNRPITVLEIGVFKGGSLQMWKSHFGPYAQIVGIDINPECKEFEEDQVAVRIGDQSDPRFLKKLIKEFGPFDVIIDDGSHKMAHVVASFKYLYPTMADDGVYFVEDMHTAYWKNYGGGLQREGTFIELSKSLIDELNADLSRGAVTPTDFTRSTLSMHFYDSCVVFERGRHLDKMDMMTGSEHPR